MGLITGAYFAERGNIITCVNIVQSKIDNLHKGTHPTYEPGLEELDWEPKIKLKEGLTKTIEYFDNLINERRAKQPFLT